MKINRDSFREYSICLKGLTNEELSREIWMLEEHIKYLKLTTTQNTSDYETFLKISKEEKETRMVAQGYQ